MMKRMKQINRMYRATQHIYQKPQAKLKTLPLIKEQR